MNSVESLDSNSSVRQDEEGGGLVVAVGRLAQVELLEDAAALDCYLTLGKAAGELCWSWRPDWKNS